jgi:hypothetical protein
MTQRHVKRLVRGLALAALLGVAACEPSGPGPLVATVSASGPVGALVVEFPAAGVVGFGGVGDTRTFEAPAVVGAATRRVVVISPTGTAVRFNVNVEDVSAPFPIATVVSAADASNQPIVATTGIGVRLARQKK